MAAIKKVAPPNSLFSNLLPVIEGALNNPLQGPLVKPAIDMVARGGKDIIDSAVPLKGLIGMKVTPQEQDRATQGAEDFTGNFMGGGFIPNPEAAATSATDTLPEITNSVKGAVNDTMDAARTQPGGLEAGFAKIPGKGELPPIKPNESETATLIRNPETGNLIKNPKVKIPSAGAVEGQMPEGFQEAPKTTPPAPEPAPIPEKPPVMPKGPGRTITRIDLPASVYGAGNEAQVQNTIDQYVPGETAVEQYKNLQPTLDNFGKQIDYAIKSNPQSTTLHDTMVDYDNNLEKSGIYRTTTTSKGVLQQTAQKYVKQLTGVSENGEISAQSLADSLQKVNKDAGPVFKKIAAGSKLTPQDEVILAARQTVRDRLTEMYQGDGGIVDNLLRKQGDLYDAADSLKGGQVAENKATDAAAKLAAEQSNIPKGNPIINGLKGAAKHPWAVGLATTAVAPLVAGGIAVGANAMNPGESPTDTTSAQLINTNGQPQQTISNNKTNSEQPNQIKDNHASSISQTVSNVNGLETSLSKIQPDKTGYSVSDPTQIKDINGQNLTISQDQYRQANALIQNYLQQHPNDPVAKNVADTETSKLNQRYNPKLIESYTQGAKAMNLIQDALTYLNNKKPGALGSPNPLDTIKIGPVGIQGMQGGLNSNYKALSQDFSDLDKLYPGMNVQLETSGSTANAKASLLKMAQKIIAQNNQDMKSYAGNVLPAVTPTAAPTNNTQTPYNASVVNSGNPSLPPITPAQNGMIQMGPPPPPGWGTLPPIQ